MDKTFYKHYKNFAKRMIAGDRNYFVCDMICDVAIETYMNGEPYIPLLTKHSPGPLEERLFMSYLACRQKVLTVPALHGSQWPAAGK